MSKSKPQFQLPLSGVLVLEFCQYLSGPSAGLRLADLGARVIKIEHPEKGDMCRHLAIKDQWIGNDSLLFHTINRNKESYSANIKETSDLQQLKQLINHADVLIHNFRPGIMEKFGLDYESVQTMNEKIVYAEISGYGSKGPWAKKPGQDLLIQALSGLMYNSGNQDDAPTPFGLAIADILCGAQLVQAILAGLFAKKRTGKGCRIEISLLESLIDFQFEFFTTYFASGKRPIRSKISNANPLLGAPYGVYETKDSWLALAMIPISDLAEALNHEPLNQFTQDQVFTKRDEIKEIIADLFIQKNTKYLLNILLNAKLWVAELKNWNELIKETGFKDMNLTQTISTGNNQPVQTTRCPIRINGQTLTSNKSAPEIGEQNELLKQEFQLQSISE